MCLLTFFPPGALPNLTALSNGTFLNDDGHGYAIVTDSGLLIRRGLDAEEMIDAFACARHRHRAGPALFHSRFATHGATSVDNCHPFPVGGDNRTAIAHNGVLPTTVQPTTTDPRSDTRIAAEEYLPAIGSLRIRRHRHLVQRWMGAANKMVILSVDRRFRQQSYILNETDGIWDGGIWYSNDGYQPPPAWLRARWRTPDSHDVAGADRSDAAGWCSQCWTATPDNDFCRTCGTCLDCTQPIESCLCYRPELMSRLPADWTPRPPSRR